MQTQRLSRLTRLWCFTGCKQNNGTAHSRKISKFLDLKKILLPWTSQSVWSQVRIPPGANIFFMSYWSNLPGVPTSFEQEFSKETSKNSSNFVYILAKECRSPFSLTNFLAILISPDCEIYNESFPFKTCWDTLYYSVLDHYFVCNL